MYKENENADGYRTMLLPPRQDMTGVIVFNLTTSDEATQDLDRRHPDLVYAPPQRTRSAVPAEWPQVRVYFAITIILSIVGWAGLARVVRGKVLSLREEDYVQAAAIAGSKDGSIIVRHIIPWIIIPAIFVIVSVLAFNFVGDGLRDAADPYKL